MSNNLLKKKKANWNMEITIGGVSDNELYFFTRHLTLSLRSGLTLMEALTLLHVQATGKMKKILYEITERLESGAAFHEALAYYPRYFSALYLNLVKTGELSGTLEKNLRYLADNLKKAQALKQKVKSAMMYPVLIFVAVIFLVFGMIFFVLPKIIPLFKTLNVDLPVTTKILIFVADMSMQYGVYVFGGAALFFVFFGWLLRQDFIKPITHFLLLKTPVLSHVIQIVNLEMFTHTLNTLLLSGIPLDSSLQITADATSNRVYRAAIKNCLLEIQKGNNLSTSIAAYPKLFPKLMQSMLAMGERTGNLDIILENLREFYEEEVDNFMKNLSTIIEPVMLIFIGVIVGTVALGILGPIYKITGNLNK